MRSSMPGSEGWMAVSGFFDEEGPARQALADLLSLGTPRDLIEVLIDKREAARYFGKGATRTFNRTSSAAAQGALVGLILFSLISALLIAFSGARDDERLTWIMLLGPNIGVMLGGFVGLWWGALKPQPMPARYARLRERPGILMVARTKSEDESRLIEDRLKARGAQEVRIG